MEYGTPGMPIRATVAMHIMGALVSTLTKEDEDTPIHQRSREFADASRIYADALIAELNKTPEP